MQAVKIAAGGCYRVGAAAGHEVKKRFFLDRVTVFGNYFAVDQRIEDAVTVFTDMADAPFPLRYAAAEATEAAVDLIAGCFFVKESFFHGNPGRNYTMV